jgi:hypothetical protein
MTIARLLMVVLVGLLAGSAFAQDGAWEQITPAGEAICGRGEPYSFFVREAGASDKLLLYFAPGGACWDASTCQPNGMAVDTVTAADSLPLDNGIFDFANEKNPVSDHTIVYIASCTGDVHMGNASVEYTQGDESFTFEHRGFVNASAALDYVYQTVANPAEIIVTGSSAGAYGAIFHLPHIAQNYADSQIVMLGDGGVGMLPEGWNGLEIWGATNNLPGDMTEYASIDLNAFNDGLYTSAAANFPNIPIAQYTAANDQRQTAFYMLQGGVPTDWIPGMEASMGMLMGTVENFRGYVAWGDGHTILNTPEFYSMQVNGVRFLDWFNGLTSGAAIENVHCDDCVTPELAE